LRWFLLAGGVAGLILLGTLFFFDPARSTFYPGCMFRHLTGWLCPGCGGLRATHQLLHGNVGAAFRLNPLVVLVLPVFAFAAFWSFWRPASRWPQICLYATLVIAVAFGILRNL
jgi:hypothetical protein